MKFSIITALATLALAKTPSGFLPSSTNDLSIIYNGALITEGSELTKDETASVPKIAFSTPLLGTFAVLMLDSDVPANSTTTTTFLHWALTGMVSSNNATTIDGKSLYTLSAPNGTKPLAGYTGPAPPAKNPFSHTYTMVLVNHTDITTAGLAALTNATQTRLGFDMSKSLVAAGLDTKMIGGSFFNVSNTTTTSSSGKIAASGTGSVSKTAASTGASKTGASAGASKATASPSSTVAISAGKGIDLSRTAVVSICLLTVGAGFMGL